MRDYKNIKGFQLADELVIHVYRLTKGFPSDEQYGLISQIRRAAVSVPANIVEGASRQHKKEHLNFLYNARGSLAEIEYFLHLSNKLGYFHNGDFEKIDQLRQETAKTLFGLIQSVEKEV
jgi:four helix bundle protein